MICENIHTTRANRTQSPVPWRDIDESPLMVGLPAGDFVMGENDDDKFANDTERPAHRVCLGADTALSRFPVTVAEFRKFRPGHSRDEAGELPVVNVTWNDAREYCGWLTERTGRDYRLPSEAEWEFACRAGGRTSFSGGDELTPSTANYLYDENGIRVGVGRRTAVGQYAPNAFGYGDLHGNVCEWVADTWHPDYTGAPGDGSAWVEAGEDRRVIRGGAWDYLPRLLRSAWRDWRRAVQCADNLGFRVAAGTKKAAGE